MNDAPIPPIVATMHQYATYRLSDGLIFNFDRAFNPPTVKDADSYAVGQCDSFVASVGSKYVWQGEAPASYTPTLADNQSAKIIGADTYFAGLFYLPKGFSFSGVLYQIDPGQSQPRITAKGAQAALSIAGVPGSPAWDPNFYWIAADNSHVAMTAMQMYAFAMAVDAYATACILQFAAIKQAIAGAPDQTTLDAIDVTAGYPSAVA